MNAEDYGLWGKCMLEGQELDEAVARVLNLAPAAYSTDWSVGGTLVEANQIFLDPPHDSHVHGGKNAGWHRYNVWTATVSSRVRGYTNRYGIARCVGRGMGSTPLVAIMRAIVASFGDEK